MGTAELREVVLWVRGPSRGNEPVCRDVVGIVWNLGPSQQCSVLELGLPERERIGDALFTGPRNEVGVWQRRTIPRHALRRFQRFVGLLEVVQYRRKAPSVVLRVVDLKDHGRRRYALEQRYARWDHTKLEAFFTTTFHVFGKRMICVLVVGSGVHGPGDVKSLRLQDDL